MDRKPQERIIKKIVALTTTIETNYPELYNYLDETPLTVSSCLSSKNNLVLMQDHYESLKQILEHYIQIHKLKTQAAKT